MADTMTTPRRGSRQIPLWYYGAGAGGLFVLYYLYSRSKKNAAAKAAAATPMAAATTASTTPVVPAGSYGQDNSGAIQNIEQQLATLNASQAATQGSAASSGIPTTPTPTTYAPPTDQTLIQPLYAPGNTASYGYANNPGKLVTGSDGHTYQAVTYSGKPGEQSGQQLSAQGIPQYYQPLPGIFSPSSGNSALTYVRVS